MLKFNYDLELRIYSIEDEFNDQVGFLDWEPGTYYFRPNKRILYLDELQEIVEKLTKLMEVN